ncbi:hypothetical protein CANCADRAFT_4309 [Tortispora caseinolytica NRRL Y-17796]|uniref:Eukaryotic translation initiation factor 3 subunit B n=1 Tax=Tortispora caseinolytica NRRL Y-17796 TaxID=767744 RepID=A0A1E4TD39_9ASCO|nr:hypothetical protein CANCADRAFT_4309 [Tortispora caseinolytica NRRL Y-17796]
MTVDLEEAKELGIDFSDLESKYVVTDEPDLDAFVVADGVPKGVPAAKHKALRTVLRKFLSPAGPITPDNEDGTSGIILALNDDGTTKGTAFVEYETKAGADTAATILHKKRFDKNHTILVNKLSDVIRYTEPGVVSDTWTPPEQEPYTEREHLRWWLADKQGRDQFIMQRGDDTGLFWNCKADPPEKVAVRPGLTEQPVRWSPLGSYLISLHRQGVQIWSGPSFQPTSRYVHPNVAYARISPNESYLVTYSPEPIQLPPPDRRGAFPFGEQDAGKNIAVWELSTGALLRTLALPEEVARELNPEEDIMRWSPDERYVARLTPGQSLSIYELPSMGLIDKKSIRVEGIRDFSWCPTNNIAIQGRKTPAKEIPPSLLAYWTPEVGDQAARVSLMTVPNKEVIRTRNLVNVNDVSLHWQNLGRFLCVKVDRHSKSGKSTFSNLEFYRATEAGIPVEVMELRDSQVLKFAWEPNRDRFVVICADPTDGVSKAILKEQIAAGRAPLTQPPRTIVSFYGLEHSGPGGSVAATDKFVQIAKKLERRTINTIRWNPNGRFLVLTTLVLNRGVLNTTACDLEFFDFDYEGDRKENKYMLEDAADVPVNVMKIGQSSHYGATDIDWDPSGRYVTTASSFWIHNLENGYKIYDIRGAVIREERIEALKCLLWRPRPPTPLSKDQIKQIRKQLREKWAPIFDAEDVAAQSAQAREVMESRRRLLSEWTAYRANIAAKLPKDLFGVKESAQENIEEYTEEVLSEQTEVIE